ncbi:MAG: hypothetical protein R2682_00245 [Pyrinomonadaceae bacterium]
MMRNANTRLIYGIGVVLLLVTSSWSQRLEAVPSTEVMPVIIAQPDSPLRIEEFSVVRDRDTHRISTDFTVRNTSDKVVKEYLIMSWYDTDTGWIIHGPISSDRKMLPGQAFSSNPRSNIQRGSISAYDGKLKRVVFAMVYSVIFEDGTEYSAESTFKALRGRLEEYGVGW